MEQENTSFSMGFRSLNPYSSGPILLTRHLKKKARQLDARQESLDPRGPKNVGFRRSKKNVLCLAIEMYIRVLMHDVV